MKKEINKAKKVVKNSAKVAVGVKVAAKVGKDASKAVAVAKTVKKVEKKVLKDSKIVSFKIKESLDEELKQYCKTNKISKNKAIVTAIEKMLEN